MLNKYRSRLSKHIAISNILMLMIPLIAIQIPLFSNQIQLFYYNQIIPTAHQFPYHIQESILKANPIYKISRYILSHFQFDSIHFFANSYNFQSNFAFIKGYAVVIRAIKYFVEKLDTEFLFKNYFPFIQNFEIQIVILIIINKVFFALTAFQLNKIAFYLTKDHQDAYQISVIYLYNPACIFFHSVYTQSIFTFMTFTAIRCLLQSQLKLNFSYFKSLGLIFISVFFRSNGIFLSPLFGIPLIYQLWEEIKKKKFIKSIIVIFQGAATLGLLLSPFIWYQHFIYISLCSSQIDLRNDQSLRHECSVYFPNLYNVIQKKFWSVGFMSYWKSQNAIFIMLGFPALIFGSSIFKIIFHLFKVKKQKLDTIQLVQIGLQLSFLILYTITLTLTNIQSSTRFFSSHVVFYLLLFKWKGMSKVWISLWYFCGGILFCIGFPWT